MPPVPKSSHCDIRLNAPENSGVTAELCLCWNHLTTAAKDISRALQTLARAGAPVDLLEALEAWSDGQMQQAA